VQIAYSKRHDSHIVADDAKPGDAPFLCMNPECRRPVTLHRTSPHYHFQHSRGKGSPSCFLFVGRLETAIQTSSLPKDAADRSPQQSTSTSLLFSGDTPSDFSLEVRLPGVDPGRPWSGSIVIHERGERRVQFDQIRRRVSGLRPQTSYQLECRGDVDQDYKVLLRVADIGLNQALNIFPYSIGGTSLVESGRPLRCGATYWIISREPTALPVDCDPVRFLTHQWQGWWVSRLELPNLANLSNLQVLAIESWLGRPLSRESSRVLICSPFPHHFSNSGIPVFPIETQSVTIQTSDFGEPRLELDGATQTGPDAQAAAGAYVCRLGSRGRWSVLFGSRRVLEWEVAQCPTYRPPSIVIASKGAQIELFHPEAAAFISAGALRQDEMELRFAEPKLLALIEINERSLPEDLPGTALPLNPQKIESITAGNFGSVEIATIRAGADMFDEQFLKSLVGSVRWLHGLSIASVAGDLIRMSGQPRHDAPPWIKVLASARWSRRFAPQIRLIELNLHNAGVWHVR
jgi:hypothetical protein